jgi:predicted PurR-regulated permease PerM
MAALPKRVESAESRKDSSTPLPTPSQTRAEVMALAALAVKLCGRSLSILTVLAIIVFVRWAHEVLIPITIAVLLSYALTPVVRWLKTTAKFHEAIGAALTLTIIVGALGLGLTSLQPQTLEILDLVPRAVQKFNVAVRGGSPDNSGAVAKLERAASEIEKAANSPPSAPGAAAARPAPPTPTFRVREYLITGTVSLVNGAGQLVVVIALVYLLLIAGDTFRRTLMRFSGDTLTSKKITVQLLDEIDTQVQRFLLVQISTSALLGIVAWAIFVWLGLDNAMTWGVVGAVLHLVPYVGPTAFVVLIAFVAFVQFDTLEPVMTLVASLTVATGIIGFVLVPWLTQRAGTLNAFTVFVSLLAWGFLWGIWGLLLGVPIMMAVKAVCDRVEGLRPIGEFLGHPPTANEAASDARRDV